MVYLIIVLSVLSLLLMTIPYFRVPDERVKYPSDFNNTSAQKQYMIHRMGNISDELFTYMNTRVAGECVYIDVSINAFLLVEWLVRFGLSMNKTKFMRSVLNIIDLLSLVFSFTLFCINRNLALHEWYMRGITTLYKAVFILFCLRIFRLFRIARYIETMKLLLLSLSVCVNELLALVFVYFCFAYIFGTCMYVCEIYGPRPIPDIMTSTWWAIITMTTVGYGDFVPVTIEGYIIGVLCCLTGVVLTALPVVITSTNFYEYFTLHKFMNRHFRFKRSLHRPIN